MNNLKPLLLVVVLFIFSYSFAQKNVEIDERLLEVYPLEKLEFLQKNDLRQLMFLNFKLDHSFEIINESSFQGNLEELSEISIPDINNINFLSLKLIPLAEEDTYYKITGTNKILLVNSYNDVKGQFKENILNK